MSKRQVERDLESLMRTQVTLKKTPLKSLAALTNFILDAYLQENALCGMATFIEVLKLGLKNDWPAG